MVFPMLMCGGFHVDRRGMQATPAYRLDRVKEALGDVYKCHYPSRPAWKSKSFTFRYLSGAQVRDAADAAATPNAGAAACRARQGTPPFGPCPAARPRTTLTIMGP